MNAMMMFGGAQEAPSHSIELVAENAETDRWRIWTGEYFLHLDRDDGLRLIGFLEATK